MDDISCLDPETIGGANLYAYCNNNPIMCVDPTGKSFEGFLNDLKIWFKKNVGFGISYEDTSIVQGQYYFFAEYAAGIGISFDEKSYRIAQYKHS